MTTAVSKTHVFIVEDDTYYNEVLAAHTRQILEKAGIEPEITQLYSKEECIARLSDRPDLILLDFYLDVNNDITSTGFDVLQKIKTKYPDIRVVIISQQHEWERFKEEFVNSGAEDFLKKDDQLPDNLARFLVPST